MIVFYFTFLITMYINGLFSALKYYSKIAAYILAFGLILVFGGNTLSPDYRYYYMNYMRAAGNTNAWEIEFSELGYTFLVNLFATAGFSFNFFLFSIAIVGILLINSTAKRYIKNLNGFYFLYAIFPFLFDVVQIRNFIMMSILVFSIRYIIEEGKNSTIKFILLIVFASLFQLTALIYLPLIFIKKEKNRKVIKLIVIGAVIFAFLSILNSSILLQIGNILNTFILDKRIDVWISRTTNFGFLYNWTLHFINLLFLVIMYYNFKKDDNISISYLKVKKIDLLKKRVIKVVLWINIYATAFLPLYVMASVYDRLMRNIMLINYIAFIFWNENSDLKGLKKKMINISYFIYIILLFIVNILISNPYVFDQIIYNNVFFE